MVEHIADGPLEEAFALANGMHDIFESCPELILPKMNVMVYLLSPESVAENERPSSGIFRRWAPEI